MNTCTYKCEENNLFLCRYMYIDTNRISFVFTFTFTLRYITYILTYNTQIIRSYIVVVMFIVGSIPPTNGRIFD